MIAFLLGVLFVALLVWSVSRAIVCSNDQCNTALLGHDAPCESTSTTPTDEVQVVDDQQTMVDRVYGLIDQRKDGGR